MGEGLKIQRELPVFDTNYYLYKLGDEYTALTGGWSSAGYVLTGGFATIAPTKNADNILVDSISSNACFAGTASLIDITNYTMLKCEITLTKNTTAGDVVFIGVGTSKNPVWTSYDARAFQTGTNGNTYILPLNISVINGSEYIYVCAYAINGFRLKKVWLEA